MNAQKILSQLMSQAKSGSQPSSGGGGFDVKSLLGGGALGMLVGSKRGRSLGGKAVKYGALAGLGALAYKAWQAHQTSGGASAEKAGEKPEGKPLEALDSAEQEGRSRVILQAMIATARADGHIDETEQAALTGQIDELGADEELHAWVSRQMSAPLDAQAIARDADSPQAAREVYLASVAIADDQNPMERAWLDQLGGALALDADMQRELERQVQTVSS